MGELQPGPGARAGFAKCDLHLGGDHAHKALLYVNGLERGKGAVSRAGEGRQHTLSLPLIGKALPEEKSPPVPGEARAASELS